MGSFVDLTGKKFGRVTVIKRVGTEKHGGIIWNCSCSCGNSFNVVGDSLKRGLTKSCGCYRKENTSKMSKKHGLKKHPLYNLWVGIRARCNNQKHKSYKNYGGRGIKICERWNNFESFISDMGDRPSPEHSIDRINNNGDYCPENCKWSTQKEQGRNMRKNVIINYNGKDYCISALAEHLGLKVGTLRYRLQK